MKRILLLTGIGLAFLVHSPAIAGESDPFPRPPELAKDIHFWVRVYTEVGTDGGFIHDSRDLGVVYEKVEFRDGLSRRQRERQVEKQKRQIVAHLKHLGSGKRTGLSPAQRHVLDLWPEDVSNATLRSAARLVRFQLGQANKFRAGVIRSGAWAPHIEQTLREMGLPLELAALPHVESSYTPTAHSRVGASGLWQFTRSTGRRFMRIDHVVDERLDPFKSTIAAAELLQQNRKVTGSWPLAITAYNHGASGMRRAAQKLGTRDIATIVRKYKSRTFGFASRNFYVEFLAASQVAADPEKYFGRLRLDTPIDYARTDLPFYTTPNDLSRALGVRLSVLKAANPALLPTVWNEAKYVPRGFDLHVPRSQLSQPLDVLVTQVPSSRRFAKQTRDLYYKVRRGDNLSEIARRHDTTVSELMALNGLRSRHRIRAGQKLRLPQSKGAAVHVASAPPQRTQAPLPSSGLYTVRRGDTVAGISRRFGITEQQLLALNDLRNRHLITVGQVLKVKATAETQVAVSKAPPAEPPKPPAKPAKPAQPASPATEVPLASATVTEPAAGSGIAEAGDDPELAGALLADPSDYSVSKDDTIGVQATETLGHYADWLQIKTNRLRQLNHMKYGRALELNHRIKLDFSRVSREDFEHARMEYHRGIQEEFFDRFEITGTKVHRTRRGESLWTIAQRRYRVPIWLIRQYNPDLDFESLSSGTRVTVPELRPREGPAAG